MGRDLATRKTHDYVEFSKIFKRIRCHSRSTKHRGNGGDNSENCAAARSSPAPILQHENGHKTVSRDVLRQPNGAPAR